MKRLSETVKRRIVEHLACYRTHAEVPELIQEEFDVSVTPRHVRAYDPTSFQFAASQRLREYHAAVRKRFETEVNEIPIAHRSFRLRRLQDIHDKALVQGQLTLAAGVLEQAAKEMGNLFTNVQKSAGVMAHVQLAIERTPEERRQMLAERLAPALARLANKDAWPQN